MKIITLILLFAASVYPCGTPTIIAGQTEPNAIITLEGDTVIETARSNPFGFFAFDGTYTPCDAPMVVFIRTRQWSAKPIVLDAKDFDGFIWVTAHISSSQTNGTPLGPLR